MNIADRLSDREHKDWLRACAIDRRNAALIARRSVSGISKGEDDGEKTKE